MVHWKLYSVCFVLLSFTLSSFTHGLKESNVIHKEGGTLEDCAKSCIQEKSIKCRYFKFINVSKTCLMSATDHPDIKEFIQKHTISGTSLGSALETDKEPSSTPPSPSLEPEPERHSNVKHMFRKIVMLLKESNDRQNSRIENLMSKIAMLQSEYQKFQDMAGGFEELSDEIAEASKSKAEELQLLQDDKVSRQKALKLLTEKLRMAASQADHVQTDINNVRDTQRTFGTEIEALRQAENDMYSNVVQINRKTTNLNSDVNNIKNADTELKKEIEFIKRSGRNKDMEIEKIRRELVDSKTAGTALKPEIKAVEKNQKTLTKALETIAHKVDDMEGFISNFQKSLDDYGQKLTSRFDDDKELKEKIRSLTNTLKETKANVDKLLNPQSSVNMERSQGLLKMKSDINVLSTSIRSLQEETKSSKLDMTNIVRDLANVQLTSQDMKNQLGIVARASKQLQTEMVSVQEAERQKPSVVEVAQMHKRVLVALKASEDKQARLLEKVQQYQQEVADLAERFNDAGIKPIKIPEPVTPPTPPPTPKPEPVDAVLQINENMPAQIESKTEEKKPVKSKSQESDLEKSIFLTELKLLKDEIDRLRGSVKNNKETKPSTSKPTVKTDAKAIPVAVIKDVIEPITKSPTLTATTTVKPTQSSVEPKSNIPDTKLIISKPDTKPVIVTIAPKPETDTKPPTKPVTSDTQPVIPSNKPASPEIKTLTPDMKPTTPETKQVLPESDHETPKSFATSPDMPKISDSSENLLRKIVKPKAITKAVDTLDQALKKTDELLSKNSPKSERKEIDGKTEKDESLKEDLSSIKSQISVAEEDELEDSAEMYPKINIKPLEPLLTSGFDSKIKKDNENLKKDIKKHLKNLAEDKRNENRKLLLKKLNQHKSPKRNVKTYSLGD